MKYLYFLFAVFFAFYPVFSQPAGSLSKTVREPVTVPKFTATPTIDGKLNEEVWKQAGVFRDLIQVSPGDNISPTKPTEVFIGYDEKHLYVAFKCWDEKDKIRSSVVERDDIEDEDYVEFWLDTYNDQRRAYAFGFNPLGIQMDGVYTENQGTDTDVDIVFESKGVIEDWGWSVEVKIPFKSIHYASGKGKSWGFNVERHVARLNNETNSWVALPRGVPGFLNKFGKITGLDEIKTERTVEVIPTVTAKETGYRESPTRFLNPPGKLDVGFTVKYSLSPNVTLDAAVNPDFADAEADAPVVEANQRFPIYFSEKRPFFLEGVDIFRTPIEAVYTRRIENPDFAAKLSGKIGKTSFGILGAVDSPLYNPADKKAFAGVLRVKRDVGKESSIGFLGTSYSYPEQHNHVAGFDTNWKINKQSSFRAQVLGSVSKNYFYDTVKDESNYGTGKGVAYTYSYNRSGKNRSWGFGGNGTSDKFRADLGFTSRTDYMSNYISGNLNSDPRPKAFVIRKSMGASFGYRNTFSGRMQSYSLDVYGNLSFRNNAGLGGGFSIGRERIYEDEFGTTRAPGRDGAFFGPPLRNAVQHSYNTFFYKQFNKRVSVDGNFAVSFNGFDYDFGAGPDFPRVSPAALKYGQDVALDPGEARGMYYGGSIDLKPTDNFNFGVSYSKDSLKRNATNLYSYKSDNYSFNSTYQFSRFVKLKARIYYNTLSDQIFGQYTFAWTPSVGKALYIGYNSSMSYKGYEFGSRQPGFMQMNRTFFIKMTYLFRKSF